MEHTSKPHNISIYTILRFIIYIASIALTSYNLHYDITHGISTEHLIWDITYIAATALLIVIELIQFYKSKNKTKEN